jgi:hypothetical protein
MMLVCRPTSIWSEPVNEPWRPLGTVIVGEGINPAEQREAFRAVVPRP